MLRPVLLALFWLLGALPVVANPVRVPSASGNSMRVSFEGFNPNSEVQVGVGLRRYRASLSIKQGGMSFFRFTSPEGATAVRVVGQENWTALSLISDQTANLRVTGTGEQRQFLAKNPKDFWSTFVPSFNGYMKVGRSFFYRGNGDSIMFEFNVQAYRLAKADACGRISLLYPVSGSRAISSVTVGQTFYRLDSVPTASRLPECSQ
ncbi:hypothetical protein [Synechococcus sp. PCC 6312]|uniref:hypothetical protein n=1 Tax=Synechococcus sp. (strain ATCC 27167 / PCC 6312) TaxID=195253 RepID=UPI00029EF2E2|nr:hypothetical protein [Synechococcus sp. PCC 6312]AFY61966.1 hypothetical protein Syn6312_2903 [Synechococcus sp. PCC 6312]